MDLLAKEEILDACAGGENIVNKSRMQNDAGLFMELHADRLPKLKSNLERLRFNSVEIVQGDARNP